MGKSCSVRHLLGRRADPGRRAWTWHFEKWQLPLSADVDGAETVAVVRCAPAFMTGSPRSHETAGEPSALARLFRRDDAPYATDRRLEGVTGTERRLSSFYERPILNSPYRAPELHHPLDENGQPIEGEPRPGRRPSRFIVPVPASRKKAIGRQASLDLETYTENALINEIRGYVEPWRALRNPADWGVTGPTQRLLEHWRHHDVRRSRPFFCQIEAVETVIWLTEVAPQRRAARGILEQLVRRQRGGQPGADPPRAEAGDRQRQDDRHGDADRLADGQRRAPPGQQALHPRLPDRHARHHDQGPPARPAAERPGQLLRARELVPPDMLRRDPASAKIVITNYHAFKLRETLELSEGRAQRSCRATAEPLKTLETEGQMLQRVMPELMGMKNILVLNDEAHHCYREKAGGRATRRPRRATSGRRPKKNNEAARLWISGLEAVKRKLGVARRLRPLGDAVLPARLGLRRGHAVPLDDERLLADGRDRVRHRQAAARAGRRQHPRRRDADVPQPVGAHPQGHAEEGRGKPASSIRSICRTSCRPRSRRSTATTRRPSSSGSRRGIDVPPVFIVVCKNTAISKLVYDYISGFERGERGRRARRVPARPPRAVPQLRRARQPARRARNTLLIDSEQLESGEALDDNFRDDGRPEIERFRREIVERDGDAGSAERRSPTRSCCARS